MLQTYTAAELLAPSSAELVEELVQLVTSSFTEDPGTKWLFTNHTQAQYLAALPHYFRTLTRAALLSDATVVVSREDVGPAPSPSPPSTIIRAAAVLIPPHGNEKMNSIITALRAGFLSMVWHCGLGVMWKLLTQLVPAMEAMHARMFPDSAERGHHFTLLFLGARPEMQGKGLGRELLLELQRFVAEEAAKTKRMMVDSGKDGKSPSGKASLGSAPLYLEASTPTSKRLYARMGFVQRDTLAYGKLDEGNGKDLDIREDGEVIGGRMFAMIWSPA